MYPWCVVYIRLCAEVLFQVCAEGVHDICCKLLDLTSGIHSLTFVLNFRGKMMPASLTHPSLSLVSIARYYRGGAYFMLTSFSWAHPCSLEIFTRDER